MVVELAEKYAAVAKENAANPVLEKLAWLMKNREVVIESRKGGTTSKSTIKIEEAQMKPIYGAKLALLQYAKTKDESCIADVKAAFKTDFEKLEGKPTAAVIKEVTEQTAEYVEAGLINKGQADMLVVLIECALVARDSEKPVELEAAVDRLVDRMYSVMTAAHKK
ncbi:TPA: hypothetical protein HA318_02475 [Candidatus Micrarchaeota archaeon]|nr:hypothetical protein [Candidatus Micrarchaeota archaeon]